MAEVGLELDGAAELIANFDQAKQIIGQEYKKASDASLYLLVGDLKEYPPEPFLSSYERTLTLGRTWAAATPTWKTAANGFFGKVVNPTPYGPWVQGHQQQAWMHVLNWLTDEDALEMRTDDIQEQFEAATRRVVARLEEQ